MDWSVVGRLGCFVELGALLPAVEFWGQQLSDLECSHGREVVVESNLLEDEGEPGNGARLALGGGTYAERAFALIKIEAPRKFHDGLIGNQLLAAGEFFEGSGVLDAAPRRDEQDLSVVAVVADSDHGFAD